MEKRELGGWFRPDQRLFVNGRDRTKVVYGVHDQISVLREILTTFPEEGLPLHGVLCFVGPNWRPLFPRPFWIAGVQVMWPAKLVTLLKQPGKLTQEKVRELAAHVAEALPPA